MLLMDELWRRLGVKETRLESSVMIVQVKPHGEVE